MPGARHPLPPHTLLYRPGLFKKKKKREIFPLEKLGSILQRIWCSKCGCKRGISVWSPGVALQPPQPRAQASLE